VVLPVVIVGAAMAGLRTAESLRRNGYRGPLTIIGDELHAPYNRPPLSKEVLSSEVTHAAVAFPQRAATADVTWMLGASVASADLDAHTVTTEAGDVVGWSVLVIATGLRPKRVPGIEAAGAHTVRTLDDAMALREKLVPGAEVVVLGSGFIGCEVAATATKLGCTVTVVSPSELPILRPLGRELAAELLSRLVLNGVHFRLSTSITRVDSDSDSDSVVLATGERLPADVLIEAVGSDCNTEWLAGTDLELSDGVLADTALRALSVNGIPHDDVFVVGDVARFPNPLFDNIPRRVEHWNIPTETGKRAGAVIAARLTDDAAFEAAVRAPFAPMPSFWSDQFDVSLQAYGMPFLADEIRLLEGNLSHEAIIGYYTSGRLIGVVGLGVKAALMPYRKQIEAEAARTPLA
jgi:3-phenylpropionate/trans-cinnamate dioxygenase ferredoxin reductase subunit